MFNSVPLDRPVEFVIPEPLESNPMISRVSIKIAYSGMNRNGSYISKETMTNMAKTSLRGTPIVGHYIEEINDFSDHAVELEFGEDMEIKEVTRTKAYGYVPEEAAITWESYSDEGIEREYLVTEGYLWTKRYPETQRIFSEGNNNQSMELDPDTVNGFWSIDANSGEPFYIIEEANFTALCILGADIEPAFEGANVSGSTDFTKEKGYEEEMRDFKEKLAFALKHNFDDESLKVAKVDTELEEEGIEQAIEQLDRAIKDEPDNEVREIIENTIDTLLGVKQRLQTEDQTLLQKEEDKETAESMGGEQSDIISDPQYSTAAPITKPFEEEDEMTVEEKEALEALVEEQQEEEVETDMEDNSEDQEEEEEEVTEEFADEEKDEDEKDKPEDSFEDSEDEDEEEDEEEPEDNFDNSEEEDLQEKLSNYKSEVQDLSKRLLEATAKTTELEKEVEELRNFKLEAELEEKEEMLSQFSLLGKADKEEIRSNFSKMSVEDVEAECAVKYYRNNLIGQNDPNKDDVVSYNLEGSNTAPKWVQAVRRNQK